MERARMSFEEKRRELLRAAKQQGDGGQTDPVEFNDKQIPKFLEKLRDLEEQSRSLKFVAR